MITEDISPSTATGSSVDNKSNTFLGSLFSTVGSVAQYAGQAWVDRQVKKSEEQDQARQMNNQMATNYWGQYNGSGPIDPGLAAVYSRQDPTGKFYADPIAAARQARPATSAIQQAGTGNSMMFASIALLGLLLILLRRR